MRPIRVDCPCSWVFYVSWEQGGRVVNCPVCGRGNHASLSGSPKDEPGHDRRIVLVSGLIVFALVSIGGLLVFSRRAPPREDRVPEHPRTVRRDPPPAKETGTVPEKKPEVPRAREDVWEDHVRVDESVYLANIAGIVAETLRHRGDGEGGAEVQRRQAAHLRRMESALDRITRNGESHKCGGVLRPGDRIEFFEQLELRDDAPTYALDILAGFLERRLRAGTFAECTVIRDGRRVHLLLYWSWIPEEAVALVRLAGVSISPAVETPTSPLGKSKLSSGLLALATERLAGLHPYYRNLLAADENARLDEILKTGEGYIDDEIFLRSRILVEFLAEVEAEVRSFSDQAADLAQESSRADVLRLKDGSKREGTIVEETAEFVRLEVRSGKNRASLRFDRADIARIERGGGTGTRFAEKLKEAGTDVSRLAALLVACEDPAAADTVAWRILLLDPDDAQARVHLGYKRDSAGVWRRPIAIVTQGGKFKYQGRWWTLPELERRLAASGMIRLSNGLWYTKKAWTFVLDNLYSGTDAQMVHSGTEVLDLIDEKSDVVYDVSKLEWVKRDKKVHMGRCVGLRSGQGTVRILVSAPGPLYRCRVTAPAKVTAASGSVLLRISAGDNPSQTLYRISGKGSNARSYDASSTVLGCSSIVLEAHLRSAGGSVADAMFLPCTKYDRETLKISGDYLVPADEINRWIRDQSPSSVDSRATKDETVVATIRAVAAEVLESDPSFSRVVSEMQSRSIGLLYQGPFQIPGEYGEAARVIREPLSFRPDEATEERLREWWAGLTPDARLGFAQFFGLWCAARRAGR